MKRVICTVLVVTVLLCSFSTSVFAKTSEEIAKGVIKDQEFFDDMYELYEQIRTGDQGAIFLKEMDITPNLIDTIKHNAEDDYIVPDSSPRVYSRENSVKGYDKYVVAFLRGQIVFDDLVLLTDSVLTGDAGKIYSCVLEIYPDFVEQFKKVSEEDPTPAGSVMSDSNTVFSPIWFIIGSVGGMTVGACVVFLAMRKKLKYCKNLKSDSALSSYDD